MGIFHVQVRAGNIHGGDTYETEALVDTGATDAAFPADFLHRLRIQPEPGPDAVYVTADGSEVHCKNGYARITINLDDGQVVSGIAPVAFWPDESGQCIGATTLQNLKLGVDSLNEKLIKVRAGRRGWAGSIE